MANSSSAPKKKSSLPKKPYPTYPLTPHASGAWQKKIRGKVHYFGRWGRSRNGKMERLPDDGWKDALEIYKAQADDLHAGRTPRTTNTTELTIQGLCNAFLTAKLRRLEAGELTARTFTEYRQITDRLVAEFGKNRLVKDLAASDFDALRASYAKQYGPVRLGSAVQGVRSVFKYGYEAGLIDRPVRFGPGFTKPSASVLRRHRAASGKKLFTTEEIRWLLDGKETTDEDGNQKFLAGAGYNLRAMILLAINCGFGNSDVSDLQQAAVDLAAGRIEFPRPKTGIERRCFLWQETVDAIKLSLEHRHRQCCKADADCVFITSQGNRWQRVNVTKKKDAEGNEITRTSQINSVGLEFGKVLKRLGIDGRKGLGFYSLRHTFRTVADATKDFPAVRLIMGHADGSIDAVYREEIDDSRLIAVSDHVRQWLFGTEGGAK